MLLSNAKTNADCFHHTAFLNPPLYTFKRFSGEQNRLNYIYVEIPVGLYDDFNSLIRHLKIITISISHLNNKM